VTEGEAVEISLVIPVRDEAASIEVLLDSIEAQTRQPDEVIVVDGGSTDETLKILEHWVSVHEQVNLRVLRSKDATPGKGRNIGIAGARNDWIVLTDAGIRLDHRWMEQLVAAVERDQAVDVVYGNYEPHRGSFYEECAALAIVSPKQERPGGTMRGPFIASSLLRREIWKAVGGFPDLRAAEDRIFIRRIEERGARKAWAPSATVHWQLPAGPIATFKKMMLYSQHNVWASQQRYWHYGIAKMYAVGLLLALAIAAYDPLLLPLLPVPPLARALKSIWRRREGRSAFWALSPARLLGVAGVLLLVDAATFAGWIRAVKAPNTLVSRQASRAFIERD
jgi:glycosyltransferase involved in cell wall biosynthesis